MDKGILVELARRPDGGRRLKTLPIESLLKLVEQGKASRRNRTLFYETRPAGQDYTTRDMRPNTKQLTDGKRRGRPAAKKAKPSPKN